MSGPKTLDELLIVVPGLTRARSLNAETLRLLLDRGAKECTWCGVQVTKGRSKWCSDACVEAFQLRCCSNTIRTFVSKRDQYVCQICGFNTYGAEAAHRRGLQALRLQNLSPAHFAIERDRLNAELHCARGSVREVDHIIPVIEGGGLCTLDNMRLVCGTCHLAVSNELVKRRKARRSRKGR